MMELMATLALLWGAGMFVLCTAGLLLELRARRRSPFPRASDATRRVGGPVASPRLLTTNEFEQRRRAARDRAINQVLRDAGYPVDDELEHRGSRQ